MAIERTTGFLLGSIGEGNVITPVTVAAAATTNGTKTDILGASTKIGAAHLWLYVKRTSGASTAARVKFRLNGVPDPAAAAQPEGDDYRPKMALWAFDADVPALTDGYKVIDLGVTDRMPRYVSAEVYNGHSSDSILVAVRYEAELIS